jgi:putative inorganic carbon (HCO3(-)) transporter
MSLSTAKNGKPGHGWPLPVLLQDVPALAPSWVAQSLVVALFAPLALLSRPSTRRILLAILLIDIPMQVGVHLWNRDDVVEFGSLGGLNISVTTFALALLYLSVAIEYLASPHRRRLTVRWNRPLGLYVCITAISAAVAQDVTLTLFEVGLFLQMLLVFIYVASWITSEDNARFVMKFLLIGLAMESVLMIWLAHHGSGLDLMGMRARLDVDSGAAHLNRVGGSIGSANGAGAYLSVLLGVAASVLVSGARTGGKLLAAGAFALGTFALMLTYSRGGFTAFLVSIGLVFLLSAARSSAARKWVVVALVVLAVVLLLLQSSLATRLLGDDADAAYSRIPLMRLAFRIIADHPLLGVGANNFGTVMDDYVTGNFRHDFLYTVHNRYLLIWAETGLLGLLAYLWFLFSILRRGWQCWKMGDKVWSPIALGLTAGIAGHMVQMFVDAFRGRPLDQLIWVIAAMITGMHAIMFQGKATRL